MSADRLPAEPGSFTDVVRRRVEEAPDEAPFTFLADGEHREERLTWAQLDQRARAIAVALQELGARGEPVLLLHPPGLDYVAAVCGCLYAGAIAVPAYPPDPARLPRTLPRLRALIADAGARIALTTSLIRGMAVALSEQAPELGAIRWEASDEVDGGMASIWRAPPLRHDSVALLQYTSGSTGAPRGVMLSHGNLLHNSRLIHHCFGHGPRSRGVIWLPPYHDMGLIGGVLQPLYGGFPVTLMSPLHFLERPLRWLRAVFRYQATTSGGPNFAYELCVRKIKPEEIEQLDLRSWDLAFNGAEPIRAETLERFAAAFGRAGFRREAFYPCYGLAEATLIASGGEKAAPAVVRTFRRAALAEGRAEPAEDGEVSALVGCGRSLPDQQIVIVEPETGAPCAPGIIGEIWLAGPSVAQGYWRSPEQTAQTFGACGPGGEGPFLRTGDLGFMDGEELFVAGRARDLLIIRGRNHYPQDIERTVEQSHAAVRAGCCAALSVELDGEERLAVVAEIDPRRCADPEEVLDAIRGAVAEEHDLAIHTAALVPPGGIPKTSSGKIQRRACREQLVAGTLEPIAARSGDAAAAAAAPALTREALVAAPPDRRESLAVEHLRAEIARLARVAPEHVDPARSLLGQGLDSLAMVELRGALEVSLGVSLPLAHLFAERDVGALARDLLGALEGGQGGPRIVPTSRAEPIPLSFAQRRLWFLNRIAPESPAYNLPIGVGLKGPLDTAAIARSLSAIVARHEPLRTTFALVAGEPAQAVHEPRPVEIPLDDVSALSPREAEEAARRIAAEEARRRFDIEVGPVLRARMVRIAPERHLLLVTIHHIVADGWSMGVLARELGALYRAFTAGAPAALPPLPFHQGDVARAERRWLDDVRCEELLARRREALAGAPPLLSLRCARPRPAAQTFRGEHQPFQIPPPLHEALRSLCRAEELTLFMALLAGFLLVLHAEGGGDDLVVGTDVAGRTWAGADGLIGLFVNQLVLRADLSGEPTGSALLRRVCESALGAFACQELPFDKLVEGMRPARDPRYNPLFQVMFVLENAPMPAPELSGLEVEVLPLESAGSPFDISVLITPSRRGDGLEGLLRYNPDLYDPPDMARVAARYEGMLAALVEAPGERLGELSARAERAMEERRRVELERLQGARAEKWKNLKRKGPERDGGR